MVDVGGMGDEEYGNAVAETVAHDVSVEQIRSGTFAALHVVPFRRMWIAGMFAFLAVNSQAVARAWLAREITGSNAGLGGVMMAFGVAMLASTPFGGVVADRFEKRAVMFGAMFLLFVSSLWIVVALLVDGVEYWMLLVTSAIQAMAFSLFAPARMAYTAALVPGHNLSNAIVLSGMSAEGMRVVGPTIAGIVIGAAVWGMEAVYIAGSIILVAGIVMTFTLPKSSRERKPTPASPLHEIAEGLRYVASRRDLSLLVVCSLAVIISAYPFMTFLPSVSAGMFDEGAAGYGVLSAASAVGALAAGLVVARRGGHLDPWPPIIISGFGFALGVAAIGITPTFTFAIVVIGFAGGMSLAFQSTSSALLLRLSASNYHGRIQSIVMLAFSGNGIISLPLGALADAIGLRTTLSIMGLAATLVMVVFVVLRRRFVAGVPNYAGT